MSNIILPKRKPIPKYNLTGENIDIGSSGFDQAGFTCTTDKRKSCNSITSTLVSTNDNIQAGSSTKMPTQLQPIMLSRTPSSFLSSVTSSTKQMPIINRVLSNPMTVMKQVTITKPYESSSKYTDTIASVRIKHNEAKSSHMYMKTSSTTNNKPTSILTNHLNNDSIMSSNDVLNHPFSVSTSERSAMINDDDLIKPAKKPRKSNVPEGLISDNFVRLNMKNKRGACKGSLNKRVKNDVFRRRQEASRASSIENSLDEAFNSNGTNHVYSNKPDADSYDKNAESYQGLQSLGIDPLSMSIESYDTNKPSKPISSQHAIKSTSSTSIEQPKTSKRSRAVHPLKDKLLLQDVAPSCPGHKQHTKLCVVKKKGPNKGRKFYACSNPREQQCKFFMWVEDNPEFAKPEFASRMKPVDKHAVRKLEESDKRKDVLLKKYHQHMKPVSSTNQNADDDMESNPSTWDVSDNDDVEGEDEEDMIEFSDSDDDSDDDVDDMPVKTSSSTNSAPSHADVALTIQQLTCNLPPIEVLKLFYKFNSFRAGQEWAIQRALQGQRSLLVSATGSGKSLCYSLPALMLPGLTIVVSPLLSLMEDQAKKLPIELPSAVLRGNTSTYEANDIVNRIIQHQVKVLFTSPERLCSGAFRNLISLLRRQVALLPSSTCPSSGVSLLCIDEAHCMSQWSYNFRPAFLGIRKAATWLEPSSILALTATAPPAVQSEIAMHLGIDVSSGVHSISCRRDNLILRVTSVDDNDHKLQMLHKLLVSLCKKDGVTNIKAKEHPNIIIYAWRRSDAESISSYIQALGFSVGCYHAGLSSVHRTRMQNQFESGKLKIIVATIAFGMGIDKADVNIVIHSYLPSSVEDYMQQTGRAGRNGQLSRCYMLMNDEECLSQHALAHAHKPSQLQLMAFLSYILIPIKSTEKDTSSCVIQQRVCLSLGEMSKILDISETSIQTFLAVLEQERCGNHIIIDVSSQAHLNSLQGSFRHDTTKYHHNHDDSAIHILKAGDYREKLYQELLRHSQRHEFNCTLYDISSSLDMTIEQVIKQLYSLQAQGIVQYSLSDPSYIITISSYPPSSDDSIVSFESKHQYHNWFIATSHRIYTILNSMDDLNAQRVLDMRAIAKLIEHMAISNDDSIINDSQDHIRQLLSDYMYKQLDLQPHANSVISEYHKITQHPPFIDPMQAEEKVLKDAAVIRHDPDVMSSTANLATIVMTRTGIATNLSSYRIEHVAMIAFKVLYGVLGTAAGSATTGKSIWRGSSYWGRHQNVDPETMMKSCSSI